MLQIKANKPNYSRGCTNFFITAVLILAGLLIILPLLVLLLLLYVGQYTNLWWLRQLELQIAKAVPQCQRYQVARQCEGEFVIPEISSKIFRVFMNVNVYTVLRNKHMETYSYEIWNLEYCCVGNFVSIYFDNHHEIYGVLEL